MVFLLLLFVLILINAYFSAAEIAFISVEKFRVQQQAEKGTKKAQRLLDLLNNPDEFLSSIQVGITLVGLIEGLYGGELLQQYLQPIFLSWGMSVWVAHSLSLVLGIGLITYLTIILGELLPKSLALQFPQRTAFLLTPSFRVFTFIGFPFIALLTRSTNLILGLLHIRGAENQKLTDEDLKTLLSTAYRQGTLAKTEVELHQNIFRFYERKIGQIMTPLPQVISVKETDSREEIGRVLRSSPHMFFPVVDASNQIKGFLSAKEFFMDADKPLQELILPACFISEDQSAPDLLGQFKSYRYSFGIVVSNRGEFRGIVTIHDIGTLLIGEYT